MSPSFRVRGRRSCREIVAGIWNCGSATDWAAPAWFAKGSIGMSNSKESKRLFGRIGNGCPTPGQASLLQAYAGQVAIYHQILLSHALHGETALKGRANDLPVDF